MGTILISSFEPFGIDVENSSQMVMERLPEEIQGHRIVKVLLPVSFHRAPAALKEAVDRTAPDLIVMLGLAARNTVCLERIAINWAISKGADNDGFRAKGMRIIPEGPDGLFTRLPIDAMASAHASEGLPLSVSNSVGTFVCNCLYYEILRVFPEKPALFIHIPLSEQQASLRPRLAPFLSTTLVANIIERLIGYIIGYSLDKLLHRL